MSTIPPTSFIIPDLVSHCHFNLRINRHHKQATAESKRWLFRGDNLTKKSRNAIHGLKTGRLTSMCYPEVGCPQLRVCCDFLTYLFHLDDLSDDMDNAGTKAVSDVVMNSLYHPYHYYSPTRLNRMTKDFYRRILPTASPGTCQRFIESMDLFFRAVHIQAIDRTNGIIPDIESYISQRRDTSGCKPCWALIEYANNLDIPDQVMEHPVIQSLGEAANDLVTWSNDIFSYNVEQSKGDTHNMICVVMHEQQLDLQSAVDFVGELCKQSIDRFNENRDLIPSWGHKIDKDVAVYVRGLADWIVGSLHWSFDSTRYFQNSGQEVKRTRVVNLLPRRKLVRPITQSLDKVANDFLTLPNDIISGDAEQSKGDARDMIHVVYKQQLQFIDSFNENCKPIPSWGQKFDKDVATYVRSLADRIVGSLHRSFDSTRYFQHFGQAKRTRVVDRLPRRILERPVIHSLGEAANHFVTRPNDIISGDAKQSKRDARDMIPVVVHEEQPDLQSAVSFVGELCKQSVDNFNKSRKLIPKIQKEAAVYVCGLAGWIIGSLHWSFD